MKKIFLSFIIVCLSLAGMAQVRLGDFKIVNLRELLHSNGVDLIYEHPDSADQFKYVNMADPLEDLDGVNLRTLRRAIASSLDTIIIGLDTFLVMPADTFYNEFTEEWLHSGQHIVFPERDTFYNYFSGEWLSIGEGIEMPDSLYQEFNEHWLTFKDTIVHDDSIVYFREDPTCPGCFNYRMYGVPTWSERFCSETNLPNLRIANRSREALKIQEGYRWIDGTESTTRWFLGHFDPADSIADKWQPNKILHKSADSLKYKWIGTFIMNDTSIVIGDGAAATKAEQIALGDSSILELWTAGNVSAKGYQIGGDSIYLNHLRNFASVDSGKFAMNNGDSVVWTVIDQQQYDSIYFENLQRWVGGTDSVDLFWEFNTIGIECQAGQVGIGTTVSANNKLSVLSTELNEKAILGYSMQSIGVYGEGVTGGKFAGSTALSLVTACGNLITSDSLNVTGMGQITAGELTYPIVDSDSGKVMMTDGAGVLSLQTIATVDSFINLIDTPDEYTNNGYGYAVIEGGTSNVEFSSNFGSDENGFWVKTEGLDTVYSNQLIEGINYINGCWDLSGANPTISGNWAAYENVCGGGYWYENTGEGDISFSFEAINGETYNIYISSGLEISPNPDTLLAYVNNSYIGMACYGCPSPSWNWVATSTGTHTFKISGIATNTGTSICSISWVRITGNTIVDNGGLRIIDGSRSNIYTFPGYDGQSNQAMGTDGNGNIIWLNTLLCDTIASISNDKIYIPSLQVDTVFFGDEPINIQSDSIYVLHESEWKSNGDTLQTGSMASKNFWTGTQAEYDAISPKDDDTIYFIEQGINPFMIILLLLLFFGRSGRAQSDWAAVYSGSTEMQKIYVGEKLVWEKQGEETDSTVYLCGKWYKKVTIGTQTWLAENLYCDDGEVGIYSYNDEADSSAIYGYLYTWDAAMRVAASVGGWHLPTDSEWTTLTTYLGGTSIAGGKLKETGYAHWRSPNTGATNESGFTALPGGNRSNIGIFDNIRYYGYWWSATKFNTSNVWLRNMFYSKSNVIRRYFGRNVGVSVRLIKD